MIVYQCESSYKASAIKGIGVIIGERTHGVEYTERANLTGEYSRESKTQENNSDDTRGRYTISPPPPR